MNKYSPSAQRFASASLLSSRTSLRIPRGLAKLRALRLRLAAEKHPHLRQAEFGFLARQAG